MVRIDVTTLINRPVQEVWDFFIDFTNTPHWTRSGSEIRQTSDGPLGVGTTVESVRRVFGRDIKSQTLVATQYEPGHLICYTAAIPLLGQATAATRSRTLTARPASLGGPSSSPAGRRYCSGRSSFAWCAAASEPNWPT